MKNQSIIRSIASILQQQHCLLRTFYADHTVKRYSKYRIWNFNVVVFPQLLQPIRFTILGSLVFQSNFRLPELQCSPNVFHFPALQEALALDKLIQISPLKLGQLYVQSQTDTATSYTDPIVLKSFHSAFTVTNLFDRNPQREM